MRGFLALVLLLLPGLLFAQERVVYDVSFPNAVHHEAEITLKLRGVPPGPLLVRMSRSSPGRYALHEFARNVYSVRARTSKGTALAIERPDSYQWRIKGHDGTVDLNYTLYADRADGTYSAVDATHAHLNMPASFMWAKGFEDRGVEVRFRIPESSGWHVATQLVPTGTPHVFRAPDMAYFMDSPTELSAFTLREWSHDAPERVQTLRLALHHDGSEAEADVYAEMAKRIVVEQEGIFGELPAFDFNTYTFIADYLPHVSGDGMEHRNSTIIIGTRALKTRAVGNLGTLAHEFFHCWNVERIRPASLEPFDFEKANMSGELWFAEGFTSYYTGLTMIRAGMTHLDRFARGLTGSLNYVLNSPGRQFFSAVDMSRQAPFVDAATAVDKDNRNNTFVSYYPFGSVIGLALDLSLRTRFADVALDDVMRAMWQSYGKTNTPYTNADLENTLAEVTGDRVFAGEFFARYVYGKEAADYKTLLAAAGLHFRRANAGKSWLGGVRINFEEESAVIANETLIGSPLYLAGLDRGDEIIELDGKKLQTREILEGILDTNPPGTRISVVFRQRGRDRNAELVLQGDPKIEVVAYERAGMEVSEMMRAFRRGWLGTKAIRPLPPLQKTCPVCRRTFDFRWEYCQYDGASLSPFSQTEK